MSDVSTMSDDELVEAHSVWWSRSRQWGAVAELRRRLSEKDAECKAFESLRCELARLFGEQKPHPERTFNEQILYAIGRTLSAKDAEIARLRKANGALVNAVLRYKRTPYAGTMDTMLAAAARAYALAVPQSECPNCHAMVDDHDGFGVLVHDACDYCSHPSITGGTCDSCGRAALSEGGDL